MPLFACPFAGCEFAETSSVNAVKQHAMIRHDFGADAGVALNLSPADENRLLSMISLCFPLWDRAEIDAIASGLQLEIEENPDDFDVDPAGRCSG